MEILALQKILFILGMLAFLGAAVIGAISTVLVVWGVVSIIAGLLSEKNQ